MVTARRELSKCPFGSYCLNGIFLTSQDHQVGPDPFRKTEHPGAAATAAALGNPLQARVPWVGTNEEAAAAPVVSICHPSKP